jgi:hypothetical protein
MGTTNNLEKDERIFEGWGMWVFLTRPKYKKPLVSMDAQRISLETKIYL